MNETPTSKTPAPSTTARPEQARPDMTVEELLNFSFKDASLSSKIGSIVKRGGLSCS